ncbi:MAG: hypothetical protein ABIR81_06340 [Ginsengibacter sp.]
MLIKIKIIVSEILIILIASSQVFAQQKSIKYHSINSGGLIVGAKENSVLFQTINGISLNTFYVGLGIGLDYYNYNTVPLFADVRKTFGNLNAGFVYGDVGLNLPHKNKPGVDFGYVTSYDFKKGLYSDVGVGYKTKLIKKSFIVFTIGYSYKSLKGNAENKSCPDCQGDVYHYDFGYHRILFKTGMEF